MSYKRIVVGSQGSESSFEAVRQAALVAKKSGAKLTIVSAYKRPDQSLVEAIWEEGKARDGEGVPEEIDWKLTKTGSAEEALVASVEVAKGEGVEATTRLVEGEAAEVLIEQAEELAADLLVVGDRESTTKHRFLLGSTSERILHHAPCDVLVVSSKRS
jgi:nucleotide-binding universal stress UspA family protein